MTRLKHETVPQGTGTDNGAGAVHATSGTTIYGQAITPALDSMEATAQQDAELARLTIRFASFSSIFGGSPGGRYPGGRLATHFYLSSSDRRNT